MQLQTGAPLARLPSQCPMLLCGAVLRATMQVFWQLQILQGACSFGAFRQIQRQTPPLWRQKSCSISHLTVSPKGYAARQPAIGGALHASICLHGCYWCQLLQHLAAPVYRSRTRAEQDALGLAPQAAWPLCCGGRRCGDAGGPVCFPSVLLLPARHCPAVANSLLLPAKHAQHSHLRSVPFL